MSEDGGEGCSTRGKVGGAKLAETYAVSGSAAFQRAVRFQVRVGWDGGPAVGAVPGEALLLGCQRGDAGARPQLRVSQAIVAADGVEGIAIG